MTRDYNISGLTGWIRIDGRYVVPLLDSAAYARAAELLPETLMAHDYNEYVTLQDGWYLGLSFSGSDVIQAALDASDLDGLSAHDPAPFAVTALFDHAACIEGRVAPQDLTARIPGASRSPALIENPVLMAQGDREPQKARRPW